MSAALLVISLLQPLVVSNQAEVALLLQQAREAARTDQNARSAELFAQVLAQNPSYRREILREYADQLTYSGRSAEAIPLFREVLSREDLPAETRYQARLILALALSWSERLWESQREYESLRRDHPENPEVLRGLARVLTWRGRQRQGSVILEEVLRRNPSDREARFLLAEAQHWLGRQDRAGRELGTLLYQRPASERERKLQQEISARTRSETLLGLVGSQQSDEVTISGGAVEHVGRLRDGLTALIVAASTTEYDSDREASVRVARPGLGMRHRFSDMMEMNLRIFQDDISAGETDHSPMTHDAWITVWPNDFIRADFDWHRGTLDNIRSLLMGITVRSAGGSVDLQPTERWRFTARANRGNYSDGNVRRNAEGEVEFKLPLRRTTLIGLRTHAFEFDRLLDNGYFNPLDYLSLSATAKSRGALGGKWWTELDGSLGREQLNPGSAKWIYSARMRLEYRLNQDSYLELRLESFTSRLDSPSGFSRDTLGLSFRHLW